MMSIFLWEFFKETICAVKGTGKEIDSLITGGIEWLIEKILDNYESISKGVDEALQKLKKRQIQVIAETARADRYEAHFKMRDSGETRTTAQNGHSGVRY